MKKVLSLGLIVCFLMTGQVGILPVYAQFSLPVPGVRVGLSPQFNPPILKGIKVDPNNPFRLEFVLGRGDMPTRGHVQGRTTKNVSPSTLPSEQGLSVKAPEGRNLSPNEFKQESQKLIKYFLASLTVPENDLWVNLSPYEKNRIIPTAFGQTEMGRDLLAQDYMLKQITASLIYPEDETGKKFWKRIYEEAQKKFGTTNIPVNTFNKVWIVPEKVLVYENKLEGQTAVAYVVESRLKVMLEEDYLSLEKNSFGGVITSDVSLRRSEATEVLPAGRQESQERRTQNRLPRQANSESRNDTQDKYATSSLGSKIVREIVIPQLTREINEGKNFAQLRQVYHSLILATWYKRKIKNSILAQVYADQNKIAGLSPIRGHGLMLSKENVIPAKAGILGLDSRLKHSGMTEGNSRNDTQEIYNRYLQAFKKGVYNYIKEEKIPYSFGSGSGGQTILRKYFSGGCDLAMRTESVLQSTSDQASVADSGDLNVVAVNLRGDFGNSDYRIAQKTYRDWQTTRQPFFKGFWDKGEAVVQYMLVVLDDNIKGFQEAREAHNIKRMAELYRNKVINYTPRNKEKYQRGQLGFFYEQGGMASLFARKRKFLNNKSGSPSALLRFAESRIADLKGLVDEDNRDALKPWEIEDNHWTQERVVKAVVNILRWHVPKFQEAMDQGDIEGMVQAYRNDVLNYRPEDARYQAGQVGFFYEKGRLEGLMTHPPLFLGKSGSPIALLRLAIALDRRLKGLIDEANPKALHENELVSQILKPKLQNDQEKFNEIALDISSVNQGRFNRFFQRLKNEWAKIYEAEKNSTESSQTIESDLIAREVSRTWGTYISRGRISGSKGVFVFEFDQDSFKKHGLTEKAPRWGDIYFDSGSVLIAWMGIDLSKHPVKRILVKKQLVASVERILRESGFGQVPVVAYEGARHQVDRKSYYHVPVDWEKSLRVKAVLSTGEGYYRSILQAAVENSNDRGFILSEHMKGHDLDFAMKVLDVKDIEKYKTALGAMFQSRQEIITEVMKQERRNPEDLVGILSGRLVQEYQKLGLDVLRQNIFRKKEVYNDFQISTFPLLDPILSQHLSQGTNKSPVELKRILMLRMDYDLFAMLSGLALRTFQAEGSLDQLQALLNDLQSEGHAQFVDHVEDLLVNAVSSFAASENYAYFLKRVHQQMSLSQQRQLALSFVKLTASHLWFVNESKDMRRIQSEDNFRRQINYVDYFLLIDGLKTLMEWYQELKDDPQASVMRQDLVEGILMGLSADSVLLLWNREDVESFIAGMPKIIKDRRGESMQVWPEVILATSERFSRLRNILLKDLMMQAKTFQPARRGYSPFNLQIMFLEIFYQVKFVASLENSQVENLTINDLLTQGKGLVHEKSNMFRGLESSFFHYWHIFRNAIPVHSWDGWRDFYLYSSENGKKIFEAFLVGMQGVGDLAMTSHKFELPEGTTPQDAWAYFQSFSQTSFGNSYNPTDEAWKRILEGFPKNASILDLNTGHFVLPKIALSLPGQQFKITAVDFVDQPADKIPAGLRFVHRQLEDLTPEDLPNPFDVVVSQYGLEYSHWQKVLPKIAKVMKPQAHAVFVLHHHQSTLVKQAQNVLSQFEFLQRIGLFENALAFFRQPPSLDHLKSDRMNYSLQVIKSYLNIQKSLSLGTVPGSLTRKLEQVSSYVTHALELYLQGGFGPEQLARLEDQIKKSKIEAWITQERIRSALNVEELNQFLAVAQRSGLRVDRVSDLGHRNQETGEFIIYGWAIFMHNDQAQLTTHAQKSGGIDLNSVDKAMQVKTQGDFNFKMDPALLAQYKNTKGLIPVIISIEPMRDLPRFLGFSQTAPSPR